MSLNRGRNIFTLGNFQLASRGTTKRTQPSDPFERDPFKIQSYNFRYADRPSLPLAAVQPRVISQQESLRDCQTCFYNYNFPASQSNGQTGSVQPNDVRTLNLSKFQEYRRRKFLQEPSGSNNINSYVMGTKENLGSQQKKPYESKILNLYYGNKDNAASNSKTSLNYSNCNISRNLSQASFRNCHKSDAAKPQTSSRVHQSLASSPRNISVNRRRSVSSGCEININIKSLENNSLQENVNIKIETDSICRNLNIPQSKKSNNAGHLKYNLKSSESFVIDKRLSKFSVKPDTKNDLRMSPRESVKQLTSIYRSNNQISKKSNNNLRPNQTGERFPTLIALNPNRSGTNYSSLLPKENSMRKVKDNLKMYDCKAKTMAQNPYNTVKKGSSNLLNSSPLVVNRTFSRSNNNTRQSPLESSIHSLHSAANRCDFKPTAPLRMRSNTKLPLNVNINVFADKLKLLKI